MPEQTKKVNTLPTTGSKAIFRWLGQDEDILQTRGIAVIAATAANGTLSFPLVSLIKVELKLAGIQHGSSPLLSTKGQLGPAPLRWAEPELQIRDEVKAPAAVAR